MTDRPVYEQEQDVQNALQAIQVANKALQARAVPLPRFHVADYVMYRGAQPIWFLEVKCRNVPHWKYSSVMLFERKWSGLRALATEQKLAVGLWVRWTDDIYGLCRLDVLADRPPIHLNGRTDRGDPADVQPSVNIDLRHFSLYTESGSLISGGING
jgi:hypothetical protein